MYPPRATRKRLFFYKFRVFLQALFVLFAATSCFEPINTDLINVVSDERSPDVEVTSPQSNDYYISTMTMVGNILDSSLEEGDNLGKLESVTLSFQDNSQYDRSIYFDKDGVPEKYEPDLDIPFFDYDKTTGDFSLEFDTVGLEGDVAITLTVVDRNKNETLVKRNLKEPSSGPQVTINQPSNNSYFRSEVLVEGTVLNRVGNTSTASEVESLTYTAAKINRIDETVAFSATDGTFSFNVPIDQGFNDNFSITLTAVDRNGRSTNQAVVLLKDPTGPAISIDSPLDNTYFSSQVTVTGSIRDYYSSAANPTVNEIVSLVYKIGAEEKGEVSYASDGSFSFSFDATAYSASFRLSLVGTDWNNRITTESIDLLGYSNGPQIAISSPSQNSNYVSAVRIQGNVTNQFDNSASEVEDLTCDVTQLSIVDLPVDFDPATGAFDFTVNTTGYNTNLSVALTATDKNGRQNEKTLVLLADTYGPTIVLNTPIDNSYFTSNVTVNGSVRDKTSPASSPTVDELSTLSYTVNNVPKGNITYLSDGSFSFVFDATSYSDSLRLTLTAVDLNGRSTSTTVDLIGYPSGPNIVIDTPSQNSNYMSTILVSGSITDQGSGGSSWSEVDVDTLSWSVPQLAQTGDVPFDSTDGTFSFPVDAGGQHANLSIAISATDKNGRTSTKSVTLLGDDIGPTVTIDSPYDNSYYSSEVTVTGTVRDRTSPASSPTIDELNTLVYQIGTVVTPVPAANRDSAGNYFFTIDTTSLSGTIIVKVIATDKNARSTEASVDLLSYASGPAIVIDTPSANSSYLSTVYVSGSVSNQFDSTASEVAELVYDIPALSFIDEPIVFDAATGAFDFTIDTTGTSGNLSITFAATDLNNRFTTKSLVLLEDPTGPTLTIDSPQSSSYYGSSVTVAGKVRDRNTIESSPSHDELGSLEYRIGGSAAIPVPAAGIDAGAGTYSFTFSTIGLSGTVSVQVTAKDLNLRETTRSIQLLTFPNGPEIEIFSPDQNTGYTSTVSVSGRVSNQESGGTEYDEVTSLIWASSQISDGGAVVFDPADGTFSFDVDTSGYHNSLAIVLTAKDLNNRVATYTLNLLGDSVGPTVAIDSPLDNTYYSSVVDVTGRVRDRASTAAAPTIDELEALVYQIGTVVTPVPDANIDADGNYSFSIDTTLLSGTIILKVVATDKNGRETETTIDLLSYTTGPVIAIDTPTASSSYMSSILVSGSITDQGSNGASWSEVDTDSLTWAVPQLAQSGPVTLNPADGTYSFTVDASGQHANLSISITAQDLNGRSSTRSVTLLGDSIGPTVTIDSPIDNSYYGSTVTVTGTVRDRTSTAAAPTLDELESLVYQIGTVVTPITDIDGDGVYTFTLDTTTLSNTIILKVIATDLNERDTETSIDLLSFSTGPIIDVDTPDQNSSFQSMVTVSGTVSDQGSGGTSFSEVDTLTYAVTTPAQSGNVVFSTMDGSFSFNVDMTGHSGNASIVLTATDLNNRKSTYTIVLLGDTTGPTLSIDSPYDNTYYRSEVIVTGAVRDRNSTEADPTISELDRLLIKVGSRDEQEIPAANIDSNGVYTFTIDTTSPPLTGTFSVRVRAYDLNGRYSTATIDLLSYSTGPEIEIYTPSQSSNYTSTVTVTGKVSDQDTDGASWDEVISTVSYEVPTPFQTGTATVSDADGTFTFDIDTTGYKSNISIFVTAEDLNGRESEYTITLLGDSIGPTITLNSPVSNTRYESSVTVSGFVRDRNSTAGSPTTGEIASLIYRIIGTVSPSGSITFDSATGAFSFSESTVGNTDNIIIQVTSVDRNTRETTSQITLLPYSGGPEMDVTSPINYSKYRSTVTLAGKVRDQSSSASSPTVDEIDSLSYSLLGTAVVDQPIAWDANGSFTTDFNTIGRSGTIFVELNTMDLNGRETTETIILNDYDSGPDITISSPNSFSEFKSSVTVSGIVQDQDKTGLSTDEVSSVRYSVPALGISNINVPFDSADGTFDFTFSAVGHNTDFYITVEAFDLNNRETQSTLNLLNDDRGPVLNLTTPLDQDAYKFNVSVLGSVLNDTGDPGLDEIDFSTLRYEVPAKGDVVWAIDQGGDFFAVFDSVTGTFSDTYTIPNGTVGNLKIKFYVEDRNGNETVQTIELLDSATGPEVTVLNPVEDIEYFYSFVSPTAIRIAGQVAEPSTVQWSALSYLMTGGTFEQSGDITTTTLERAAGTFEFTVDINDAVSSGLMNSGNVLRVTIQARDIVGRTSETIVAMSDDSIAPTIVSATTAADNTYVDIIFTEGVWNLPLREQALTTSNFAPTLNQSADGAGDIGPGATALSISAITRADGTGDPLEGGEDAIRLWLNITGDPDGFDTFDIDPASLIAGDSTAIYDRGTNVVAAGVSNIVLYDQKAPYVVSVSSSETDGEDFMAGETVHFEVHFNEKMAIPSGIPSFPLNHGGVSRAIYDGAADVADDAIIPFKYTVVSGENTSALDYPAASQIDLTGASIEDEYGNGLVPDLPAPGALAAKGLIVDTIAPVQPSIDFAAADDTGYYDDDNITYETTNLVVSGLAEPGSVVRIYDDIAWLNLSDTADGSGNYTVSIPDIGADRLHPLTVHATDHAGNTSVASAVINLVIDTIAPTVVFDLAADTETARRTDPPAEVGTQGSINAAEEISNGGFTVHGSTDEKGYLYFADTAGAYTSVDPLASGDLDSNALGTPAYLGSASGGVSTIFIGTNDATQEEIYSIYAVDIAGNVSNPSTNTLRLDRVAPASYIVDIDYDYANLATQGTLSFTFTSAELSTAYQYAFDDPANGATTPVTGSGIVGSSGQQILGPGNAGIDVSSLDDSTLSLNVYLTDAAGNQGALATDSVIKDTVVPTLDTVTISSDNVNDNTLARIGNTVMVNIAASEPLIAAPTVSIDGNGADDVSNTGGNSYKAMRLMQIGDTEGPVVCAIDFTDAAGNAGTQVASVTDTSEVIFDESKPTVLSVSRSNLDDADLGTVNISIVFSETMDTGTNPSPTITGLGRAYSINGSAWSQTTRASDTWTGSFTFIDDHEEATGTYNIASFADAAGNVMLTDTSNTVTVDTKNPTVLSVSRTNLDDSDLGPVSISIVFSETMDSGTNPSPIITGLGSAYTIVGSTWSQSSVTADTWTGSFSLTDDDEEATGTYNIASFADAAGNVMLTDTSNTVTVDTKNPTVLSVSRTNLDDADLGAVSVSIVFSETMNTGVNPSPTITGLGSAYTITGSAWSQSSVTADTWTGSFSLIDDNEEATGTYNIASFTDVVGNVMLTDTSNSVAVDTRNPTVLSVSRTSLDDADLGAVSISIVFSETMNTGVNPSPTITGLGTAYTITGNSWSQTSFTADTWTGSFTLIDDNEEATGTYNIASFADAVGNVMLTDTSKTVVVDTKNPTVLSVSRTNLNDSDLGIVNVSIVFSETMNTGTNPSPTITGLGTAYTITGNSWTQSSVADDTWTGSFTLIDDNQEATGTYNIASFADAVGNVMLTDTSNMVTVDTKNPTVLSVSRTSLDDADVGTVNISIEFSETMNTGVNPSPTITGLGSAYTITGSAWSQSSVTADTWTGSFTLIDDNEEATGAYTIASFADATGNVMVTDTSNSVTVDTKNPTVISVSRTSLDDADLGAVNISIVFSETMDTGSNPSPTITGLGTAYTITGNTWSQSSVTADTWTGSFTLTDDDEEATGTYNIASFADAVGNVMLTDTSKTVVVDTKNPTVLSVSRTNLDDSDLGSVSISIVFSETMNIGVNPSPTITGLGSAYTIVGNSWSQSTVSADTWTGSFTLIDSDEEATGTYAIASFADAVGNVMVADTSNSVTVDTKNPTVLSVSRTDLNDGDVGVVSVSIEFSETMNTGVNPSPTIAGLGSAYTIVGNSWSQSTVADDTWTGSFTLIDDNEEATGTYNIASFADAVGNVMVTDTSNTVAVDTITPTVVSVSRTNLDDADLGTVNISILFSESMNTGINPSPTITGLGTAYTIVGNSWSQNSVPADTWTGSFTLIDDDEEATGIYNIASFADPAGNVMLTDTSNSVAVDTRNPTVLSVSRTSLDDSDLGAVSISIVFSETMNTGVNPSPTITGLGSAYTIIGSTWNQTTVPADTWTGSFTLTDDDEEAIGTYNIAAFADAVGNVMVTDTSNTVTVDTKNPTVLSVSRTALKDSDVGVVSVSIVFSETMDSGVNPSPTITGLGSAYSIVGSSWSQSSVTADTWTGSFTLTDDNEEATGTYNIASFADAAGNVMVTDTSNTVAVDTITPTVVSVSRTNLDDGDLGTVNISILFSESMNTGVNPSPTITGLGSAYTIVGSAWSQNSVPADTWTGSFTLIDDNEEATGTYNIASFADPAGNVMLTDTSNSVAVDTRNPTVLSVSRTSLDDADLGAVSISIVFSETMNTGVNPSPTITGLGSAYTITGSAWTQSSVADDTWTGSFTLIDDNEEATGTYNIASFADAVGNVMLTDTSKTVVVDTKNPTVLSVSRTNLDDSDLGSVNISIVFSETMNTGVNPSPTVTGLGSAYTITGNSWTQTSVAADTWTGSFTLTDSDEEATGTYNIASFADAVGNIMLTDTSNTVTVDTKNPTVLSVSRTSLDDADVGTVNISIEFSETMNTGVNPSPTITGLGSAYTITGSAWSQSSVTDDTWTGSFTLIDDNEEATGTYNIASFADASGNVMLTDTLNSVTVDTRNPTVLSVSRTNLDDSNLGAVSISIVFSETMNTGVNPSPTITGLGTAYTITGSSWSQSSVTADTWTGSFTLTDDNEEATGTYNIASFADAVGNVMLTDTSKTVVVDTKNPTVLSVSRTNLDDSDLGSVNISIVFSETMNMGVNPSPTITGLGSAYTIIGNSWSQSSVTADTWTGSFTLIDSDEEATGTYAIASFADAVGNVMVADTSNSVMVDTKNPTVLSVSRTDLNDGDVGVVSVSIEFSETMNTGVNPSPTIAGLGSAYTIVGNSWSQSTVADDTWTGSFTLIDDNEEATGTYSIASFADAAGNVMVTDTSNTVAVDTITPTVVSVSRTNLDDGDLGTVTISILFSESMNTGVNPSPTITGLGSAYTITGNSWSQNSVPADTWTGSFTLIDDDEEATGTYNIASFADPAGNVMLTDTSNTVAVDTRNPTVISVSRTSLIDSDVGVVNVSIQFSETMATGTNPSPTITGLGSAYTIAGSTWSQTAEADDTWTGSFTLIDDEEEAIGTYNIASFTDAVGNVMASDSTNTVSVDTTTPTVLSVSRTDLNDGDVGMVSVSIEFSETMATGTNPSPTITGLGSAYTIVGNSWSQSTVADDTWTGSFTLNDDEEEATGTYNIASFADPAGNVMVTDTSNTVAVDTITPTVVSVSRTNLDDADLGTVNISILFSESMNTGINPSPTITGLGSAYTITGNSWSQNSVPADTWTGSFTLIDDDEEATGTYNIASFADPAGNVMATDTSNTVAVDTRNPTVISVSRTSLIDSDVGVVNVSIQFSETMATGTNPSPTITGLGSAYTIAGSTWSQTAEADDTWTGSFTLIDDEEEAIGTYNIASFTDAVGNVMASDSTNTVSVDTAIPTIISVNPSSLADADVGVVEVSIQFSESMDTGTNPSPTITGLTTDPYTIIGSAWSQTSVADDTWTGSFTLNDDNESGTGTYNISQFTDFAGNEMATDNSHSVTVSTPNPTVIGVTPANLAIADVGVVNVSIVFSETMDTATNPSPTITGLGSSYTISGSSWSQTTVLDDTWSGTFTFVDDTEEAIGVYQLSGFKDTDGNTMGADSTHTVDVDTVAPTGYAVAIDQSVINSLNETIVGFIFSGAEVGTTYNYSIDDPANGSTDPVTGSGTISDSGEHIENVNVSTLDDSTLTLTVSLTDPAGNTGADATDTVSKDTVAPSVPTGSMLVLDNISNSGSTADTITNETVDLSISGGGADSGTTITLYVDGTPSGSTGTAGGDGSFTIATLDLAVDGTYFITATATDAAGNESAESSPSLEITIDTTPPSATFVLTGEPSDGYIDQSEDVDGFSVTASSDEDTVLYLADTAGAYTTKTGIESNDIGTPASYTFGGGDVTIEVSASGGSDGVEYGVYAIDIAGNVAGPSSNVVIYEVSGPTILSAVTGEESGEINGIPHTINGELDYIELTFDTIIDETTVDSVNFDQFVISYGTIESIVTGASDDGIIKLILQESGSGDTGETPDVYVVGGLGASDDLEDFLGNVRSADQSAVTASDGAPAVLRSAFGVDLSSTNDDIFTKNGEYLELTFSEILLNTGDTGTSALSKNDLEDNLYFFAPTIDGDNLPVTIQITITGQVLEILQNGGTGSTNNSTIGSSSIAVIDNTDLFGADGLGVYVDAVRVTTFALGDRLSRRKVTILPVNEPYAADAYTYTEYVDVSSIFGSLRISTAGTTNRSETRISGVKSAVRSLDMQRWSYIGARPARVTGTALSGSGINISDYVSGGAATDDIAIPPLQGIGATTDSATQIRDTVSDSVVTREQREESNVEVTEATVANTGNRNEMVQSEATTGRGSGMTILILTAIAALLIGLGALVIVRRR